MLIIKIKPGDNLDKALKVFKMKIKKTQLIQKLRDLEYYDKPSTKKREKKKHAIYIQKLKTLLEE